MSNDESTPWQRDLIQAMHRAQKIRHRTELEAEMREATEQAAYEMTLAAVSAELHELQRNVAAFRETMAAEYHCGGCGTATWYFTVGPLTGGVHRYDALLAPHPYPCEGARDE